MSKTLKIKIKTLDDFHGEVLSAMKELDSGKKKLKAKSDAKDVVYFDSQINFQKFFTAQKIEMLAIIKHAKPKTIYELATLAKRQFPAVLKDAKSLEDYGFIVLDHKEDARRSIQPRLSFNYDEIVVDIRVCGFKISIAA